MDKSIIENIAQLARLQLTENEREEATTSIGNILSLIDQLQSIDTTGIEPLAHATSSSQRLREDLVTETDQSETLLALAPMAEEGMFLVPKVID
jgi:aspartyl-tRNA(Asn)/glutamyl-tRNA(Gln) amidotransferase subunit C